MKRRMVWVGLVLVVGVVAGVVGNVLWSGLGAVLAPSTSAALLAFLLHQTRAEARAARYAALESRSMALLAPDSDAPVLPWTFWTLTPDAVLHILSMARLAEVNAVVECGSGVSSVLLARYVKQKGVGRLYSLEHDPAWADLTRAMLAERGLDSVATVITAPLREMSLDGATYRWYDVEKIKPVLELPQVDILLVDGPPGGTGPLARYPTLPTFRDLLGPGSLVFMDDGYREGERRAVELWRTRYGVHADLYDTQKGLWIVRIPQGKPHRQAV